MPYSEFRFFDVINDRESLRVSMPNSHGAEFWVIIPADDGKKLRQRRDDALDMIEEAIRCGLEPGEVVPA